MAETISSSVGAMAETIRLVGDGDRESTVQGPTVGSPAIKDQQVESACGLVPTWIRPLQPAPPIQDVQGTVDRRPPGAATQRTRWDRDGGWRPAIQLAAEVTGTSKKGSQNIAC
jgi:hypothetical protein